MDLLLRDFQNLKNRSFSYETVVKIDNLTFHAVFLKFLIDTENGSLTKLRAVIFDFTVN